MGAQFSSTKLVYTLSSTVISHDTLLTGSNTSTFAVSRSCDSVVCLNASTRVESGENVLDIVCSSLAGSKFNEPSKPKATVCVDGVCGISEDDGMTAAAGKSTAKASKSITVTLRKREIEQLRVFMRDTKGKRCVLRCTEKRSTDATDSEARPSHIYVLTSADATSGTVFSLGLGQLTFTMTRTKDDIAIILRELLGAMVDYEGPLMKCMRGVKTPVKLPDGRQIGELHSTEVDCAWQQISRMYDNYVRDLPLFSLSKDMKYVEREVTIRGDTFILNTSSPFWFRKALLDAYGRETRNLCICVENPRE